MLPVNQQHDFRSYLIVTCDGKNAPYCISKALIAARNGDWENGLFFCGAAGGEVNTLSTVP